MRLLALCGKFYIKFTTLVVTESCRSYMVFATFTITDIKLYFFKAFWAGIAQSVYRLATGCTIRGSNPGWGQDFLHVFRPALWPTQPPVKWVPGLLRGVKQPGRGVHQPPPS